LKKVLWGFFYALMVGLFQYGGYTISFNLGLYLPKGTQLEERPTSKPLTLITKNKNESSP